MLCATAVQVQYIYRILKKINSLDIFKYPSHNMLFTAEMYPMETGTVKTYIYGTHSFFYN